MFFPLRPHQFFRRSVALILLVFCFQLAAAQTEDPSDGETDPIKLFERGQNAHARGDISRALSLYEAAIKLRPEFPEAEFQRGAALAALGRSTEAEKAFTRAIELKKEWVLPYSALGSLLTRLSREKEAEPVLRRALQLGAKDFATLDSLSTIRLRAGDKEEALSLARRATEDESAPASAWAWLGAIERARGNTTAALSSLNHSLQLEANYVAALTERAELRAEGGDYEHAIEDLKAALASKGNDKNISLRLAKFYQLNNQPEEARRIYESLGYPVQGPDANADSQAGNAINVAATPEVIAAANSDDPKVAQPALEKLIAANPRNAALLGRLGEVTRRSDPQKSAEAYRRANEIDPRNPKYATGYAAALVQSRRFTEAEAILRRVIAAHPDEYAAHANLALALYELKRFAEAVPEYEWLAAARPDIPATYFFIATAHDNLGEYEQALDAYNKYLSRADPVKNKLDIEKVNLRLPTLREQIKRGQGANRKKPD